jgi:hypothetical protein
VVEEGSGVCLGKRKRPEGCENVHFEANRPEREPHEAQEQKRVENQKLRALELVINRKMDDRLQQYSDRSRDNSRFENQGPAAGSLGSTNSQESFPGNPISSQRKRKSKYRKLKQRFISLEQAIEEKSIFNVEAAKPRRWLLRSYKRLTHPNNASKA